MLFSAVVGQQTVKKDLINMWQQQQLPHALLLCGPQGTGSLPMALALAQYILCEQKGPADACGVCPNCSKVARMEHADLHFSFPTIPPKPGTKAMSRHFLPRFRQFLQQQPYATTFEWLQHIEAENKQGNITAEECRQIIESLNLKAYEGGMKILVMWRPEFLGKEGNILLKLIEEPPADTLFLFAAEAADQILPTILSRTQMVRMGPLSSATIAAALQERGLATQRQAEQVARLAEGSFSEALQLLREAEHDMFPEVRNLFNALFTNNGLGLSRFAEDMAKAGREQQKNFLQYIIHLLEATLQQRYTGRCNLPEEETAFVRKLAAMALSFGTIQELIREIAATVYYIQRNAHARIQLHSLCIKLVYTIQNKKLSSLVN